jgi:peptidoglycan/LPS O-acetylase OafA/YrhL
MASILVSAWSIVSARVVQISSMYESQVNIPAGKQVRYYRPELDVLRFGAFLLVYFDHLLPIPNAKFGRYFPSSIAYIINKLPLWYGLPLFFVLSAFLITELLLIEKQTAKEISIGRFYIRRILRIWPLYFVGIAIGIIYFHIPIFADTGDRAPALMVAMYLALIGNWYFALVSKAWMSNPMTPLWSISVEEQFYAVWAPLIQFSSKRNLCSVLFLLLLASIGTQFILGVALANPVQVWTNSFVQLEMFAVGALLAIFLDERGLQIGLPLRLLILASALVCWMSSQRLMGSGGLMMVARYLLTAMGCLLLMVAFLGAQLKFPRWSIYLGRISYGLYVFHAFSLMLADRLLKPLSFQHAHLLLKFIISLSLTIALASLSYRYFETPFLRLKERFARIASRPI